MDSFKGKVSVVKCIQRASTERLDTVGKNEKMIQEYIRNQLEEDYTSDQISLKEFTDPFTGDKRK